VLSAVAGKKPEGELHAKHANEIRDAVLDDADSGAFRRAWISTLKCIA
jgi:hypothetical protein